MSQLLLELNVPQEWSRMSSSPPLPPFRQINEVKSVEIYLYMGGEDTP